MAMTRAAIGVGGDGTWCGVFCGAGTEVGIVVTVLGWMWVRNKAVAAGAMTISSLLFMVIAVALLVLIISRWKWHGELTVHVHYPCPSLLSFLLFSPSSFPTLVGTARWPLGHRSSFDVA
jgi:hypothetical protein